MSAITRRVVMALKKLLLLTLIKDKDKRLTKGALKPAFYSLSAL